MTVIEAPDGGGWVVISRGETLAGPFPTNAEAWRAADRLEGSPISPAEKRADWITTKILSSDGVSPKLEIPAAPDINQVANFATWPKRVRQQKKKAAKNRRTKERKAKRMHANAARDSQLGTFGAASPVRRIDPADYVAGRPTGK